MVYIIIACHFGSQTELCHTTLARLGTALKMAKNDDHIFVTGDVPYVSGGPTMGELMRDWLVLKGFPQEAISLIRGGLGTFSEARIACALLKSVKEITVVSSSWYLFQGKPIWLRRGREYNLHVSFISVPDTGGLRTWLIYLMLGFVVRASLLSGLEQVIEHRFTVLQKARRSGFTFDGCR